VLGRVEVVVTEAVVVVRREGAVGVIWEDVVVVDPAPSAPVGTVSETPIDAMAAANRSVLKAPTM